MLLFLITAKQTNNFLLSHYLRSHRFFLWNYFCGHLRAEATSLALSYGQMVLVTHEKKMWNSPESYDLGINRNL